MKNKIIFSLLILFFIIYAVVVFSNLSEAYIDFGDGNYLYISSRLADGINLYSDILSPQPPCHLLLGKYLIKLGRVLDNPLYTVRIFSIFLHILISFVIFLIGTTLFKNKIYGLVSSILYLFMPIGFWWSLGYQSEPLEILFLSLFFYFFISAKKPSTMIIASIFAALSCLTNMTAVPYVGLSILFLIVRRRDMFWWYFLPILIILGTVITYFQMKTGAYIDNVFLNQIGTFHREHPFLYGIQKIINEGKDVFTWEGGFIILALVGLIKWLSKNEDEIKNMKEYVGWHSFFSILSIIYVSKGATMEYIFTIGEPYVALFSAYTICKIFDKYVWGSFKGNGAFKKAFSNTTPFIISCTFILLILVSSFIGYFFVVSMLKQERYEYNEDGVIKIKYYIEKYSTEKDLILAPPYYAFITNRKLKNDYAEAFLWYMKIMNEISTGEKAAGTEMLKSLIESINNKELPIVIINLSLTGELPGLLDALNSNYTQIYDPMTDKPYQSLNESLGIFIRK